MVLANIEAGSMLKYAMGMHLFRQYRTSKES